MANVQRKTALTTKAKPSVKKTPSKSTAKKADVKVAEKKVDKVVASTKKVPDNKSTQTKDATMTTATAPTKAESALIIFNEVNGVRAEFIKRAMAELSMSKPGASTYFQNAKTKAAGEKVKHYYKPKSEKPANEPTDDVNEDAQLFNVKKANGLVESFMKMEDAQECIEANGGELISEEEAAQLAA